MPRRNMAPPANKLVTGSATTVEGWTASSTAAGPATTLQREVSAKVAAACAHGVGIEARRADHPRAPVDASLASTPRWARRLAANLSPVLAIIEAITAWTA